VEVTYHGANCIKFSGKNTNIVVDDNLATLGGKSVTKPEDISLVTTPNIDHASGKLVIDMPGEYEVSNVSIRGVSARGAMDPEGKETTTIYKITSNDISYVVLGHIFADITEEEVEELGHVDVVFVPIGGNGYTLDGLGALKVLKKMEPKIVIPTHYAQNGLKYEVPQNELSMAVKNMDMEIAEKTQKLKLRPTDITDSLRLFILEN
jgi:L-ascorbate metabolism protein UlaG (beta-lactamase superfamily)